MPEIAWEFNAWESLSSATVCVIVFEVTGCISEWQVYVDVVEELLSEKSFSLYKSKITRQHIWNYFGFFQKVLFFHYLLHVIQKWKSFKVSFLAIINTLHFKLCCFTVEPSLCWMLLRSNCKNGKQAVVFSLSSLLILRFSVCFTLFLFM